MKLALKENEKPVSLQDSEEFGQKIGLTAALFGCWHGKLSRPFTNDKRISYVTCIKCGARKRFDTGTFATSGAFYYPPKVSKLY